MVDETADIKEVVDTKDASSPPGPDELYRDYAKLVPDNKVNGITLVPEKKIVNDTFKSRENFVAPAEETSILWVKMDSEGDKRPRTEPFAIIPLGRREGDLSSAAIVPLKDVMTQSESSRPLDIDILYLKDGRKTSFDRSGVGPLKTPNNADAFQFSIGPEAVPDEDRRVVNTVKIGNPFNRPVVLAKPDALSTERYNVTGGVATMAEVAEALTKVEEPIKEWGKSKDRLASNSRDIITIHDGKATTKTS